MKIKTIKPVRLETGPVDVGSEIAVTDILAAFFIGRGEAIALDDENSIPVDPSVVPPTDPPEETPESGVDAAIQDVDEKNVIEAVLETGPAQEQQKSKGRGK
jgi:hypothetical protein